MDDDMLQEAERQLAQYLEQGAGRRRHPSGSSHQGRDVQGDLSNALAIRICSLGEEVLRQDVELQRLRREATTVPAELRTLRDENALLAQHHSKALEEVAELSARHGSVEQEANACQQQLEALEGEREILSAKATAAESMEADAQGMQEDATRALDLERRRSRDLAKSLSAALRQRQRQAEEADERAMAAEREMMMLEGSTAAARAEAATVASVASAEAERRRGHAQKLEAQLDAVSCRRERGEDQVAATIVDLAETRLEAKEFELGAEALAEQLAETETHAEETERKAMGVARELLETSQSIARLRAEAMSGQALRGSLEEAQRETGALEQRLAAIVRGRAQPAAIGTPSPRHTETGLGRDASATEEKPAAASLRSSEPTSAAEAELRELRTSQERAVAEALRSAWEHEARDRRETDLKLQVAEAEWIPLREQLLVLTGVARRCREDLLSSKAVQAAAIPPAPEEAAWLEEVRVPNALRALCDCLEALARETALRADGARRGKHSARAWPRQALASPPGPCRGLDVSSLSGSPSHLCRT